MGCSLHHLGAPFTLLTPLFRSYIMGIKER